MSTANPAEPQINRSSPRSFGLLFSAIFLLISLWPVLFHSAGLVWWALGISIVLLLAALITPTLLEPLNQLWFKLGMLLGKIMNPLIMGSIFVIAVLPIGLIMRALGKRPLQLEFPRQKGSLWNTVEKVEKSFRNQF